MDDLVVELAQAPLRLSSLPRQVAALLAPGGMIRAYKLLDDVGCQEMIPDAANDPSTPDGGWFSWLRGRFRRTDK
jgi:hypothetical protein